MKNIGWTKKKAQEIAKGINSHCPSTEAYSQRDCYWNYGKEDSGTDFQWTVVLQRKAKNEKK